MKTKNLVSVILSNSLFFLSVLFAQNPFVTEIYTADPTARVFDGKLYVYPSHDIPGCDEEKGEGNNGFCMPDYHMFTTDDLVNWQDLGVIVDQNTVPWVENNSFGMWAPDCVEKDGTYYFYFPGRPADKSAFRRIGVATATSPTGPFSPEVSYINGISGIDPGVFINTDGKAYMYYAQGGQIKMVALKDNMKEITGPITTFPFPEGYKEGPFVFKKDGLIYLTFARVIPGSNYELVYATGTDPKGPFTYRGSYMPNIGIGTNHGSIVQYKNKWYAFYHHWSLSGNNRLRSIRAEEIEFNPDGTILPKVHTRRGIGIPRAGDFIQVDRYSEIGGGAMVNNVKEGEPRGFQVEFVRHNSWVKFDRVDFGTSQNEFEVRVASGGVGGTIEVRTNATTGPILAKISIANTGGWNQYQTIKAVATGQTSGVQDLVLVFKNENVPANAFLFDVNWLRFGNDNTSLSTAGLGSGATQTFVAYSNPANQNVLINGLSGIIEAQLFSVEGQSIRKLTMSPQQNQVDVSGLTPGLYFLRLENGSVVKIQKE